MNHDDPTTDAFQKTDTGTNVEGTNVARAVPDPVSITASATRNPWDDDHPDANTPDDPDRVLTMRLLKPSLISLAACTVVVFLSAVASNNAVASSPLESGALAVHRLGMFGLLVSFLGILISYRLPHISRILQHNSFQVSESVLKRNRFSSGVRFLLMANFTLVAAIWLIAYSGIPSLLNLLQISSLISAGVLCSVALLQRGYLQAYAVGVLLPLVIVSLNWQSLVMQMSYSYGFNSRQDQWLISNAFALNLTGSLISGLISAAIYPFMAKRYATEEKQ